MHIRLNIGQIIALPCLLLIACQVPAGKLEVYDGLLESPSLVLNDLGNKPHDLADYRGEIVLLNFWATWCAPCIIEMPGMQRLKDKLADKPFRILAVNVKESEGTIWKFHKMVKVNFPLLLDRNGEASEAWHVAVYPSSYLLDTNGQVSYQATGMLEWDAPEVIQVIESMMAGATNRGNDGSHPAGVDSFAREDAP